MELKLEIEESLVIFDKYKYYLGTKSDFLRLYDLLTYFHNRMMF